MEFGPLIKYYRTQHGLTQKELAAGICSVPHLSKIEGNSKEANQETLKLLLERLGIDQEEIQGHEGQIKEQLTELNELIDYHLKEEASELMEKMKEMENVIPFSSSLYLYELTKLRYFIFTEQLEEAQQQKEMLNKQKKNFSQHENSLFRYLNAVLLLKKGNNQKAEELLEDLLNCWNDVVDRGELYYHLTLTKTSSDKVGYAIFFGNQAIQSFKNSHNFIRILHTLMVMALNYTHSKIYQEALNCYQHLIRNLSLLDNTMMKATVYQNMGYLQERMNEVSKAKIYYRKSLELQEPNSYNYLIALFSIGETEFYLDESTAKQTFIKVRELAKKLEIKRYQILATYYLLAIESPEKSVEYLETKVLPAVDGYNVYTVDQSKFYKLLYDHYRNIGNAEKAVLYLEKLTKGEEER
ncbi:helix-turn-helix domain-containing protein [Bacillus massilinigeriensis]|uniref:helix-turn-helix domain-containing protein n=1 Tax=Bacillus mediterraneensis TaxID=1805474 RepID=UPI0008F91390|nr:helix-turn-helix domain-containing protein [Bacillus mediterraneensis]